MTHAGNTVRLMASGDYADNISKPPAAQINHLARIPGLAQSIVMRLGSNWEIKMLTAD